MTKTFPTKPLPIRPHSMTLALLLLAALFSLPVFADSDLRGDAAKASAAWPLIEQGALVIDVRSQEEFDSGHLAGALHVPFEDTASLISAIGDDPQRQVVLYCGSGRRAETAARALNDAGFDNVYNATGLDALEATEPTGKP